MFRNLVGLLCLVLACGTSHAQAVDRSVDQKIQQLETTL